MKLFQCQCCGQILYFENTICLRCGHQLGYLPEMNHMLAVEANGAVWRPVPGSAGTGQGAGAGGAGLAGAGRALRFCRNWELSACNWLIPTADPAGMAAGSGSYTGRSSGEFGPDDGAADGWDGNGLAVGAQGGNIDLASNLDSEGAYCPACQHNRTVPDLSDPNQLQLWRKIEVAKRRLMYTLMRLGLPRPALGSGHPEPLVFDFLADDPGGFQRVLTGHANGVVTIALIEADDAAREKIRSEMGEAYRTLLGHFRHEVGHYYWDLLVRDGGALAGFRALFGDERVDYAEALQRHYQLGAPEDWDRNYVSAYASMHPWEDWAETWTHYLHMIDTLETGTALGISVDPGIDRTGELTTELDFNPYRAWSAEKLIDAWGPLTLALNLLNRSMGQRDSYPFTLAPAVGQKLAFVHELVCRGDSAVFPVSDQHGN